MEVYDFTSMYDKFVHADMKQKQRQLTALVLNYMKGNAIFNELDDFTGRHGFKRVSGQRFNTIEIIYEFSDSKGVTAISSAAWSVPWVVPLALAVGSNGRFRRPR
jgi:hypothetical protein